MNGSTLEGGSTGGGVSDTRGVKEPEPEEAAEPKMAGTRGENSGGSAQLSAAQVTATWKTMLLFYIYFIIGFYRC